jgi:glyoxylase-like metal-dependent hydrolase (beta-lactamase superfamily II)
MASRTSSKVPLLVVVLTLSLSPALLAQEQQAVLQTSHVRGGVHMIAGAGGNIAVFPGEDGVLLVDAGMPEFTSGIVSEIREIAEEAGLRPDLRYLINTHWHFDHVGGNASFGLAGATIAAHEGVVHLVSEYQVMESLGNRSVEALQPEGRPTLSFNDRMNLHWNGDLIHMVHMPAAHSNGDIIVHFRDADIIHMGDLFFNGMYPFIDVDNQGNIDGMVEAVDEVLAHSRPTTLFIPGHGELADRGALEAYGTMLRTVRDRIQRMIDDGMDREAIIAAGPTAEFDATWGSNQGFRVPEAWVGLVYDGMVRNR